MEVPDLDDLDNMDRFINGAPYNHSVNLSVIMVKQWLTSMIGLGWFCRECSLLHCGKPQVSRVSLLELTVVIRL